MIKNRLDRFHRAPGLILDPVRMVMLFEHVRMLVIKRRWSCARNEKQPAWTLHTDGRRIRHVNSPLGDCLNLFDVRIGRGRLKSWLLGHGRDPVADKWKTT